MMNSLASMDEKWVRNGFTEEIKEILLSRKQLGYDLKLQCMWRHSRKEMACAKCPNRENLAV